MHFYLTTFILDVTHKYTHAHTIGHNTKFSVFSFTSTVFLYSVDRQNKIHLFFLYACAAQHETSKH